MTNKPERAPKPEMIVRLGEGQEAVTHRIRGRYAWTLDNLLRAGAAGIRPIDRPAPRWSEYVRQLREWGFSIETIQENHDGPYAGHHGRYVLRSPVTVVEELRA